MPRSIFPSIYCSHPLKLYPFLNYTSAQLYHLTIINIIMIGFLPLLLSLLALAHLKPIPKCKTGFYYQTLPLIADESAILRLDSIFNGYNLNYTLTGQ